MTEKIYFFMRNRGQKMVRSGAAGPDNKNGFWNFAFSAIMDSRRSENFTSSTSAKSYRFLINTESVWPSRSPGAHWEALSLRCLSTAVEGEESGMGRGGRG